MKKLIVFLILLIFSVFTYAQEVKTPRPSPNATVTQTVGVTDVTIDYSSPGVKERTIWGELVPYGEVWRTGANEVTSITFEDPVKVNGKELEAGTYGVHSVPGENEWDVIFSKDTEVDGGSNFDKEKEVLRLKIKPEEAPYMERMTFLFSDMTDNSAKVNLRWENLNLPFTIETDTEALTLKKARENISWVPAFQGATYCLQNDVNLEEAMRWIDASVLIQPLYWNMRVKAQIQKKLGKDAEAIATMEKAIEMGEEMDNAPFDFDRMKETLAKWKK